MTATNLRTEINSRFNSSREFVTAFNNAAGFAALDETTLSRQLSGRVKLSKGWTAAYILFFHQTNTAMVLTNIDNESVNVSTFEEYKELVGIAGIDQVEIYTGKGWDYLQNVIEEWSGEKVTDENESDLLEDYWNHHQKSK